MTPNTLSEAFKEYEAQRMLGRPVSEAAQVIEDYLRSLRKPTAPAFDPRAAAARNDS